ncbi:hypothetical protein DFH07DRAFT_746190, partial [Mycena maculata]
FSKDLKQIMRQVLGGMLWTKQFYKFIQKEWANGDPSQPRGFRTVSCIETLRILQHSVNVV